MKSPGMKTVESGLRTAFGCFEFPLGDKFPFNKGHSSSGRFHATNIFTFRRFFVTVQTHQINDHILLSIYDECLLTD
jgi:hypothetical protein